MSFPPAKAPSQKQINFAQNIAKQRGEDLPAGVLENGKTCSAYIEAYKEEQNETRQKAAVPPTKDGRPPSENQLSLIESIEKKLGSEIDPSEFLVARTNFNTANRFLNEYKPLYDARIALEKAAREKKAIDQFWNAMNYLDVVPPAVRQAIQATEDIRQKIRLVQEQGQAGFAGLDVHSLNTPQEKLIAYWLEGLQSTAFESLGELPDLFGKQESAVSYDRLPELLATTAIEGIKFDQGMPPTRHLVFKLVDGSSGDKKRKPITLSVLPLMAIQDAAEPLGYRWAPTQERVPLFNRDMLGESARTPGLALDHVPRFDTWALQLEDSPQPPSPCLADALTTWNMAFEKLVQPQCEGLGDYVARFQRNKHKFWQIKRFTPVFALVDGSAAMGPSRQVCSAYKQVLAERELLNDSRLALFRRAADVEAADTLHYDIKEHATRFDNLVRYFGHMDALIDGKREAFALDPAQRDALLALQITADGELLAVNGPPGTGKTSLLRGVIASQWLAPLLTKDTSPPCPIILACAATNQAVTNVISSFDETPGPPLFDENGDFLGNDIVGADSRWLPHLSSYGWYVPSSIDEKTKADFGKYQMLSRKGAGNAWVFEGVSASFAGVDDSAAEAAYLQCAERHLQATGNVPLVIAILRDRVVDDALKIAAFQQRLKTWIEALDALSRAEQWSATHQTRRDWLLSESERLSGKTGIRAQLRSELAALDGKLARLARFSDFSASPSRLREILGALPADDGLQSATDFFMLTREHEELTLLANELGKERHASFVQRLKQAFSAVLRPAHSEQSRTEMRQLMARFQLPVGVGTPDFDAWHLAATTRLGELAARIHQAAAEGLRLYLAREGVQLTPTTDYSSVWPLELDAFREALRQQRSGLLIRLQHVEDSLAPIASGLASLESIFQKHIVTCEKARAARDALAAHCQTFGVADESDQVLLACMNGAYEMAVSGALAANGLLSHVSELIRYVHDWLDVHVRTRMFHQAARYWEGRYLLARKELAQRLHADETHVAPSEEQLRLLGMLAPVFVVTAYSVPKLMRRNMRALTEDQPPYLYGEADLLIVDEAGQGTPDIGASAFMFARRAIVVGDTAQLDPIWNVDPARDVALVQRFGLASHLPEHAEGSYAAVRPSGVLLACGSVMRMAQRASRWTDRAFLEAPGLTLTNHYRCLTPIIEICNRMVYGGALRVATRPPKTLWRPELGRLGFLVVDPVANTARDGGSRHNLAEARCIARWVHENEASIVKHYSRKEQVAIEDVLAIITPFRGQKETLKRAFAEQYGLAYNEHDKTAIYNRLTINTVHTLQGAEKQIVIFSMVETNEPSVPQFYDNKSDLINVAISRAKEMFIVALTQQAVDYARSLDPEKPGKPSNFLWQAATANGTRLNSRRLVILESANKCDLVKKALGDSIELEVLATEGHIAELDTPANWDIRTAAAPAWHPISAAGEKLFSRLATLWCDLMSCHLATDPDAEGEAIAWHVLRIVQSRSASGALSGVGKRTPDIRRMRFFKLESVAIREAYESAGTGLDAGMVKSALTRTLLDHAIVTSYAERLGLSAANQYTRGIGRVQLGVLDLVNRACRLPATYGIAASTQLDGGASLRSYVLDRNGDLWARDSSRATAAAERLRERLAHAHRVSVSWAGAPLQQLPSYPGLNTARLLALAWRTHAMPAQTAMNALQFLYEGHAAPDLPEPGTQPDNSISLDTESLE
jgi:hypothetical protein